MKRKLLSPLLALTMCAAWLPTVGATAAKYNGSQTWSMLLYMCGSNLEGGNGLATGVLLDILNNDLPDNMKIAIYTGGSFVWDPFGDQKVSATF